MRKDFCIIKNGFINLDELVYETIFIIVFWDYDSESEESSKGEVVRVPKIASPRAVTYTHLGRLFIWQGNWDMIISIWI